MQTADYEEDVVHIVDVASSDPWQRCGGSVPYMKGQYYLNVLISSQVAMFKSIF